MVAEGVDLARDGRTGLDAGSQGASADCTALGDLGDDEDAVGGIPEAGDMALASCRDTGDAEAGETWGVGSP